MNRSTLKITIAMLTLMIAVVFSIINTKLSQPDLQAAQPQKEMTHMHGKVASEFTLKNLEGETVTLADFEGKVVLLNFWATWCGPCRHEIPDFVELMETKDTDEFVIVGITVQSGSPEQIQQFANNMKINYPILHGENNDIMGLANDYGKVSVIPTTFLIDKEGTIQTSYIGPRSAEVFWNDISSYL